MPKITVIMESDTERRTFTGEGTLERVIDQGASDRERETHAYSRDYHSLIAHMEGVYVEQVKHFAPTEPGVVFVAKHIRNEHEGAHRFVTLASGRILRTGLDMTVRRDHFEENWNVIKVEDSEGVQE